MRGLVFALFLFVSPFAFAAERFDSLPFVSGDTFRCFADFIYDDEIQSMDPDLVEEGDIVFLAPSNPIDSRVDIRESYFQKIHPLIKHRYILITHNSDFSSPSRFSNYLDDENIFAWFSVNPDIANHPKVVPIPIGLENHRWGRDYSRKIASLIAQPVALDDRRILIYANFNEWTNIRVRREAASYFQRRPYCTFAQGKSLDDYLKDLASSIFVISPMGNGMDCHRTWEALLVGSIPVVMHSTLDPLFDELPVILVDQWDDITYSFLFDQLAQMKKKNFNYDKLLFRFWSDLIMQTQRDCRKNQIQQIS